MDFGFLKERSAGESGGSEIGVVLISGTCCNPSLAASDERARRAIEEAASEAGVRVAIEAMTMTSAYYAAPKEVKRRLMGEFAGGGINLPAVLVRGKAVSYGPPSIEAMKAALLEASGAGGDRRDE